MHSSRPLSPVVLGSDRYRILLEHSGAGYSACDDILLTRYKCDPSANDLGVFVYIRDLVSGEFWSACGCPARPVGGYAKSVRFGDHLAECTLEYSGIAARTVVSVLRGKDAEVRRLTLVNTSDQVRSLDLTSYAEPVLATFAADTAHPAFYKLFVETHIHAQYKAIVCSRRPRSKEEKRRFLVHALHPRWTPDSPLSFETDRYRFLGRGNTPASPQALQQGAHLSGNEGAVLDPVVAIRCPLTLQPGQSVCLDLLLGTAPDAASCLDLAAHIRKEVFVTKALADAGDTGQSAAPLEHIPAIVSSRPSVPSRPAQLTAPLADSPATSLPGTPLQLANSYGGFSADGKEYVIRLKDKENTPLPWVNVISGPDFGTVISESGSAYTFCRNAREFRLTPWHNDPVSDPSGEAVFIQDCASGEYWSPTPLPTRGPGEYTVRHGFGYSVFNYDHNDIASEMTVFVDLGPKTSAKGDKGNGNDTGVGAHAAPVKYTRLCLHNRSDCVKNLRVTGYAEWVLGDLRNRTLPSLRVSASSGKGMITARNADNADFPGLTAFFATNLPGPQTCIDRARFLGPDGQAGAPAFLAQAAAQCGSASPTDATMHTGQPASSNQPCPDPCAVLSACITLQAGESKEVLFLLACTESNEAALALAEHCRAEGQAGRALDAVKHHWDSILGNLQVRTPDPAVNVLANGWLLYQTLSCRYWARSGFYQSGGAFGFRDQLQDVLALVHDLPELVRDHILLSASRQFPEGDVQHWWHPPTGKGVRTRCSDDLLWLPAAVARYITVTGDMTILDEVVPYITEEPLPRGASSRYSLPSASPLRESLYAHCVRVFERSFVYGAHGLPLIGSCDWNDGMDKVGEHGKGESIWLGFFLYDTLRRFIPLAKHKGDKLFARRCRNEMAHIRRQIASFGWDGKWFRRAYFDDGTALGSAQNQECRIDSIAQSWSVLSGAAPAGRQKKALQALYTHLASTPFGAVLLLTPPFDRAPVEPGYIKGYIPGVRENGGQYTHAAVWAGMAFAQNHDSRAWDIARQLNPATICASDQGVARYMTEPYVMAADVYANPAHEGRGGWTWYTGAAGWMYRLFTESLLGIDRNAGTLSLHPLWPENWNGFSFSLRHGNATYHIEVRRAQEGQPAALVLDGVPQTTPLVLQKDGRVHQVLITAA